MNYTQFVEAMKLSIQEHVEEGEDTRVVTVTKNNGVMYTGITIAGEKEKAVPTFYLESFYEEFQKGASISQLTDLFLQLYRNKLKEDVPRVDFWTDYNQVKNRLAIKLVNRKKNSELLKEIPNMEFMDLAIIFYCMIQETELGSACIVIRKEHLNMWKINQNTLYQDAMDNSVKILPARIANMEEIIQEFIEIENEEHGRTTDMECSEETLYFPKLEGAPEENCNYLTKESPLSARCPMVVLTNSAKYFGAAAMLYPDVLKKFGEEIEENFYILPSSIHEVILVPQSAIVDEEMLINMVKEVNSTQLEPQDILADSLYFYDREKHGIIRCC